MLIYNKSKQQYQNDLLGCLYNLIQPESITVIWGFEFNSTRSITEANDLGASWRPDSWNSGSSRHNHSLTHCTIISFSSSSPFLCCFECDFPSRIAHFSHVHQLVPSAHFQGSNIKFDNEWTVENFVIRWRTKNLLNDQKQLEYTRI